MANTGPRVPPRVQVRYEVTGAQEGAAAVHELALATLEHAHAQTTTAESAEAYDRAIASVKEQLTSLKTAQDGTNNSVRAGDQGFDQLAQRGVVLAARFAGVANAAAGLLDRLGGPGSGASGHLLGSVFSNIAQFAALGAMLGPAGAVVGGLVGATTAVYNLVEAHNDGEAAAREHVAALDAVAAAARAARAALTEERNFEAGGLALTEMSTDDIAARRERALVELGESGTPEDRAAHRSLGRELSDEEETRLARLAATGNEAARARVEAERTRDAARELVATLDEELARRNEIAGVEAARQPLSAPLPPRHGGRRRTSGGAEEPVDEGAFLEASGIEAEARGLELLAERRERDRERDREWAEEDARDAERRIGELEAIALARHQAELDRIAVERGEREKADRAAMEALEEQTAMLEDVGDTVGGIFAGAFSAAIQGQEDFGTALAKGTKAALINFGTTMVAEGIGALFTGIGNTVINPPAAATKLAEGAGKIALGVGLGAAGAAIPTGGGSAPSARAERPRVDQAPGSGAGAQPPMVVQLNAPTILGGSEQEVGRLFERVRVAGVQRYGAAGGDR